MTRSARPSILAFALAVALAGCQNGDTGRGQGVVRATYADGRIEIEHGDIPGIMKAMTMEFEIDPALLAGIETGDRVSFRIEAQGGRYRVTELLDSPAGGGGGV